MTAFSFLTLLGASALGIAGIGGDQAAQDFTLQNHTHHRVMTLNVSPTNSNRWGPDILGEDTIAAGASTAVSFSRDTASCHWDIRATYDDNTTSDERDLNLCEVSTVELTGD